MLECDPSPLQRMYQLEHVARRRKWASMAVGDAPIDLKRRFEVPEPSVEETAPVTVPEPILPEPDPTVVPLEWGWLLGPPRDDKMGKLPPGILEKTFRVVSDHYGLSVRILKSTSRIKSH